MVDFKYKSVAVREIRSSKLWVGGYETVEPGAAAEVTLEFMQPVDPNDTASLQEAFERAYKDADQMAQEAEERCTLDMLRRVVRRRSEVQAPEAGLPVALASFTKKNLKDR